MSTPARRPTLTAPAPAGVRDVRAGTEERAPQGPNRGTCATTRTACHHIRCRNWYSIFRTVSDDVAHRDHRDDRSVRGFAVKPRAFGAPLCGFGA